MILSIRQALILAAVGASLLLGALGAWKWQEARLRAAERARDAAEAQAAMNGAEARVIERYTNNERVIEREASNAIDVIETAPGADTPVPADVLDAWRSGIDGLRDNPAADNQRP